jgi:hypothetical protein
VAGCLPRTGFVRQEQIDLAEFVHNRFGRYYDGRIITRYSDAIRDSQSYAAVPAAFTRQTLAPHHEGKASHDEPDTLDSRSA